MQTDEPQSPLAALPSVAALLAYVAKTDGLDTVAVMLDTVELRRETLLDAADTLRRLGLIDLARLIRDRGVKAKSTPIEALPFPLRRAARRARKAKPTKRHRRPRATVTSERKL